jgi:leader peptidase (prepilin peptidase)/N-methyltransferase
MTSLVLISSFLFGTLIGSFLNVCIYRLPAGRSIVRPGSSCPKCGHSIRWWENIPIISWIFLRARCSSCGASISVRYPLVELLTGLLSMLLIYKFGLTINYLVYLLFTAALIAITFIDLDHRIIPDSISLPGILVGFAVSFIVPRPSPLDSLIGIVLGGGILYLITWGYYLLTKKIGMGGGDIKLLAMIGAFLGWQSLPLVIFVSAMTGSVIGLVMMAVAKGGRYYQIPFGPFLALGALVDLFAGDQILNWYLSMLSSPGV